MRRTLVTLATAALLGAPMIASATPRGFDTTITAPVEGPVNIEVMLSDDLAHRADNLPKKLRDRGSAATRLRAGFAGNGYYGQESLDRLLDELREELVEDFSKRGIPVSENAPVTLRVTLEDVRNNRPTFEQMTRQPQLSLQSFGLGGAELSGELVTASGESLGTVSYRRFETMMDDFAFARAAGVWTDANRAISRFSSRTAKALS
ncbi:MAG: hypothetical protein AAF311_05450 [Pseudomonadota bacterium]